MGRRGYQRVQGVSVVAMLEAGELAKRFAHMNDETIQATIDQIGGLMKGPMSNFERTCAHEDRKELRAEQVRRAASPPFQQETKGKTE